MAATLFATELDYKLETTAKKLTEAAETRKMTGATLAVFPLQADEKLSKKKVNFAVSEILTKNFLKSGKFTVIERAQLEEVMKEQKLGLSGAVDSAKAAEIGKLAGAKLLVLGNVIQMGNSYQLTAKLVDAETSEMIASEITEVPVKTFDEDAERYLVLVPDRQTLAIQLLLPMEMASMGHDADKTFTLAVGGNPVTANSESRGDSPSFAGVGIRYFPLSWLVIEGAYFVPSETSGALKLIQDGSRVGNEFIMDLTIGFTRLGVAYTRKIGRRFRLYAGLEALLANVKATSANNTNVTLSGNGAISRQISNYDDNTMIPMARLGLEWKPQERLGFGLYSNIGQGTEIVRKVDLTNYLGVVGSPRTALGDVDVAKIKIPAVSVDLSFSFYF